MKGNNMKEIFHTTKEDVEKMTWDEIKELMDFLLRNNLWNAFITYMGGKPPHVIRHDVELRKMNK
jgi:hypothetical protein|tara:strand:- start:102 stop:296 length:195 start_codon:yes stop_codon:yes gene_type:complete